MFQHGDLVLRQKPLGKEPVRHSSTFQVSSSHPFAKGYQNLLVADLVNGVTFRYPIHVNNPSDVEKNIIPLNLDLFCRAFFCLCELGSSSAWIVAYFLARIEKPAIHHKL
jgi:hypothetical protein